MKFKSNTKTKAALFPSSCRSIIIIIIIIGIMFYNAHLIIRQYSSSPSGSSNNNIVTTHNKQVVGKVPFIYPLQEPLDVVFLYVNGTDPMFQEELSRHTNKLNVNSAARRYRDIGQLKYALRSVFDFAPFIRNIYIVVNNKNTLYNQIPNWLNATHENIRIVEHKEIWRYDVNTTLPSFNSHAMEWSLPNLFHKYNSSRSVWYFNDDFSLMNHIHPYTDIWSVRNVNYYNDKEGHQQQQYYSPVMYEAWEASRFYRKRRPEYGNSVAFVRSVFNKKFGYQYSRRYGAHTPWLMNFTIMEQIAREFESVLQDMYSNGPFRTNRDLQTMFAYQQYIQSRDNNAAVLVRDYKDVLIFDALTDDLQHNRRVYDKVLKFQHDEQSSKIIFLCLQDAFDDPSFEVIQEAVQFYEELYPHPAPWELVL